MLEQKALVGVVFISYACIVPEGQDPSVGQRFGQEIRMHEPHDTIFGGPGILAMSFKTMNSDDTLMQ